MAVQIAQDLYLEERRQAILDLVQRADRVSVVELSGQFGVSEVTIRADLQALAERNLVVRTHGGAVPATVGMSQLALAMRRQQQVAKKSRIGSAGAALVANGDAVYLDSSSTSLAIAQHLKDRRHVTILTNSLAVAQEMLDAPGVDVVMSGGALQKETASLIGVEGLAWLDRYNIQTGFFGAHGISDPEGLTDVNAEQAAFKRPLVQMCRRVVAVLDSTKWKQIGLASFAALDEIDAIITDADAPVDPVQRARDAGIKIEIV
jgi:DeoR family transcriptional regulator of aga operon